MILYLYLNFPTSYVTFLNFVVGIWLWLYTEPFFFHQLTSMTSQTSSVQFKPNYQNTHSSKIQIWTLNLCILKHDWATFMKAYQRRILLLRLLLLILFSFRRNSDAKEKDLSKPKMRNYKNIYFLCFIFNIDDP